MLMTTVQWTSEHARQEEGPFRLKGVGGWDLFSSSFFQTGGVVLLFANKCVFCFSVDAVFMIRIFFSSPLLSFHVSDARVCARMKDLRLGKVSLQRGCVCTVSLHVHTRQQWLLPCRASSNYSNSHLLKKTTGI